MKNSISNKTSLLKQSKYLVLALIIIIPLLGSSASAAGSVSITVEPSSGNFKTGTTNDLSLYGTTSGANTSGFSFTVTLTNMTISSFDATGNPFSIDNISSGGTPGSSTITITTGYSNPAGGSGKQFIGKLKVIAPASAGSAKATVSTIDAYDSNLDPMAITGSVANYTVTVPTPATPATTSTPQAPASSASTQTTNKVTVPTSPSTPSPQVGESTPEVVSQAQSEEVLLSESPEIIEAGKTAPVTEGATEESNVLMYSVMAAVGVIILVASVFGIRKLLIRRNDKKLLAQHVASVVPPPLDAPAFVQAQPVTPNPQGEQPGPTIIHPDSNNTDNNSMTS